jgi:release factor glutamine methyltransferase
MKAATIGDAVADTASRLAERGIESPRLDARLLVSLATGLDQALVLGYPERPLDKAQSARLAGFLERRLKGEPVSRIAGRREFWSHEFALSRDTLDPRADTEALVEAVLERIDDSKSDLSILDLGTGTGCLLLSLLAELPCAWGIGTDIVPGAASLARRNAASMDLENRAHFIAGSWFEPLIGRFDVIVANPPYVASGDIGRLAPEVAQFDPRTALDGGPDGLQSYRALAPEIARHMMPEGFACIEVGAGQADEAAAIFVRAGLDEVGRRRDMAGTVRCLVFVRTKKPVGIRGLLV